MRNVGLIFSVRSFFQLWLLQSRLETIGCDEIMPLTDHYIFDLFSSRKYILCVYSMPVYCIYDEWRSVSLVNWNENKSSTYRILFSHCELIEAPEYIFITGISWNLAFDLEISNIPCHEIFITFFTLMLMKYGDSWIFP